LPSEICESGLPWLASYTAAVDVDGLIGPIAQRQQTGAPVSDSTAAVMRQRR
jgi:hypothetical protein